MGLCVDRSVNYLQQLGLNTILQPREGIAPLALIGEADGQLALIGTLDQLVKPTGAMLPTVTSGAAANIDGQRSSKLPVELGVNLLGGIISAMGGNLGIKAAYSKAKRVEFQFADVVRDRANVIQIGDYLSQAEVRWSHPVLAKYLFNKGNLYVLTEVVWSSQINVSAFDEHKGSIALDIPVIEAIVGGKVSVGLERSGTTTVSYRGDHSLAFGFVAIELYAGDSNHDGELDLTFRPTKAGRIALSVGAPAVEPVVFDGPLALLQDAPAVSLEGGKTQAGV